MMRRKATKEGRTTLYIVDRQLWKEAKDAAASRNSASVSEVIFDAIKSSIVDSREVDLLRALEKHFELSHFSIGAVAEACHMTRAEVVDRMNSWGIDLEDPDVSKQRREIHKRLRLNGAAPREERVLARFLSEDLHQLDALHTCFENQLGEFANEYQLLLDTIWQSTSQDKTTRSWFEGLVEASIGKDLSPLFQNLHLESSSVSVPGPRDWHYALAYFAAVGLAFDQGRLLRDHFEHRDTQQVNILSWLSEIRAGAQQEWKSVASATEFSNLWKFVTQERLDGILASPTTTQPETVLTNVIPRNGPHKLIRDFVAIDDGRFPIDLVVAPLPAEARGPLARTAHSLFDMGFYWAEKGLNVRRHSQETLTEEFKPGVPVPRAIAYSREFKVEVTPLAGTD